MGSLFWMDGGCACNTAVPSQLSRGGPVESEAKEGRMASLDGQWKALQKQLARLEVQTRKVRGEARKR